MVIVWTGSVLESVIYVLCVITSMLCAGLLIRAYRRAPARLLIWCAICFAMLALNNLVLAVDVVLLPEIDLTMFRIITALGAVSVLLYGFIWDA